MAEDAFAVEKTSLISRSQFYFEDPLDSSSTNNHDKRYMSQYTLQSLNLLELDNNKVNKLESDEFEKKVKHFSFSSEKKGILYLIHELEFYGITDLTQPRFQTEDFKNGLKHDWEIDHPAEFGDLNLSDEPSLLQVLQLLHFAGYAYQIKIYIIFNSPKNLQIGKKRSNSHLYFNLNLNDNQIEIIQPVSNKIEITENNSIFTSKFEDSSLKPSLAFLQEENPLVIFKRDNIHLVYIVNNYDSDGKFPVYDSSFFNIITPYELLYLRLDGFSTITYILRDGDTILYGKSSEMGTLELDKATTVLHELQLNGSTYISSSISQYDVVKTENYVFFPQSLNLLTKQGDSILSIYHIYQHETEPFQSKQYIIHIENNQYDFRIFVIQNICFILYLSENELKYYSYEIDYSTPSASEINEVEFKVIPMKNANLCGLYYKSFYFVYEGKHHKHQVILNEKAIETNDSATIDDPTAELLKVLFPIDKKQDNLQKYSVVFYESLRTLPTETLFKTVAVEINNHLFIQFEETDNFIKPLFHPIETMSIHRFYILNLYEKFYQSMYRDFSNTDRKMLYTIIDFGYYTSLSHITQQSTNITHFSPGIYYKDLEGTYLQVYFFNENMQNLVTEIRSLAQLAAAFSCSYAIRVYQANSICVEYKQRDLNMRLFTMTTATLSMFRMAATYGTLLEMKNLNQFKFALTVLEPTKGIDKEEFLSFVRRVIGLEQL